MSEERRESYFDAAYALLESEGYGGLKLAPLCARLEVTTGAFYHSFDSWRDFTSRLLDHWRQHRTTALIEVARSEGTGGEMLEVLLAATLTLPHGAEAAIRVWSTIDPDVAMVQSDVDLARYAVVHEALTDLLGDSVTVGDADRFARMAMMLLIGFEQEAGPGPRDSRQLAWSLRIVKDLAERSARPDACAAASHANG